MRVEENHQEPPKKLVEVNGSLALKKRLVIDESEEKKEALARGIRLEAILSFQVEGEEAPPAFVITREFTFEEFARFENWEEQFAAFAMAEYENVALMILAFVEAQKKKETA